MINPQNLKLDLVFERIKAHHKRIDEELASIELFDTHAEAITSGGHRKSNIQAIVEFLSRHFTSCQNAIEEQLKSPSFSSKLLGGASSLIIGAGLGAAAGVATKAKASGTSSFASSILSLGVGGDVAGGLVGTAVGLLTTKLMWEYYKSENTGEYADDFEKFKENIKDLPITKAIAKNLQTLAKEIVMLFCYREMLLLGKVASDDVLNRRDEFIKTFNLEEKSADEINLAIEYYFSQQLSLIFQKAFNQTWSIQEQQFAGEQNPFTRFFHQLFQKRATRENFTLQIQQQFMAETSQYLYSMMAEKNFLGRHPYAISFALGILACAIVTGVLASNPVGWAIGAALGAGLVVGAIVSLFTKYKITKIPALITKRGKKNRDAIQTVRGEVDKKVTMLCEEIERRPKTSKKEIKKVSTFERLNNGFLKLIATKQCAYGAVSAWLREYAERYNHSAQIETDLKEKISGICEKSATQSQKLRDDILKGGGTFLGEFLKDTQEFLKQTSNAELITQFELREKIKEQLLTVIASLPENSIIPDALVEFFTTPTHLGGLASSKEELDFVNGISNSNYKIITDGLRKMTTERAAFEERGTVLCGEPTMLASLGYQSEPISINGENIQGYLDRSFEFLFSLQSPVDCKQPLMEALKTQSPEFIIYRTLLFNQLAKLWNNRDGQTEPAVKLAIEQFMTERFGLSPQVIFDDIENQSLLEVKDEEAELVTNAVGTKISVDSLKHFTNAIVVDLSYGTHSLSPLAVLKKEVNDFDKDRQRYLIAAGKEQRANFQVGRTPKATEDIRQFIAATKTFMAQLQDKEYLSKTGLTNAYKFAVTKEVYRNMIVIASDIYKLLSTGSRDTSALDELLKQYKALKSFAQEHCFALGKGPQRQVETALDTLSEAIQKGSAQPLEATAAIHLSHLKQEDAMRSLETIHALCESGDTDFITYLNADLEIAIDTHSAGKPEPSQTRTHHNFFRCPKPDNSTGNKAARHHLPQQPR